MTKLLDPATLEKKLAKHMPHKVMLEPDSDAGFRLAAMKIGRNWCAERFSKEFVVYVGGDMHYDKKAEWYLSHTGYFHFARKKDLKRFKKAHGG